MTIKIISLALDSKEPNLYSEIDNLLTDGYEIINTAVFKDNGVPWQRLMLRKDETKAAATPLTNVQVRAITSVECRETYSKSTQQYFKFWTCELDSGDKVNVFDHPDASRNTYNIVKAAGFLTWEQMSVGDTFEPNPPMPVTVTYDGEWYSLADIIKHDHYFHAFIHYPDAKLQPDTDERGLYIDGDFIPTSESDDVPWDIADGEDDETD